jgi:hypothetical protein
MLVTELHQPGVIGSRIGRVFQIQGSIFMEGSGRCGPFFDLDRSLMRIHKLYSTSAREFSQFLVQRGSNFFSPYRRRLRLLFQYGSR